MADGSRPMGAVKQRTDIHPPSGAESRGEDPGSGSNKKKRRRRCEGCGKLKYDVRRRDNAYAQEIGGKPHAEHVVCDSCGHENRMDI